MLDRCLRLLVMLYFVFGLANGLLVAQEVVITLPDNAATQEGDAGGYGPTAAGRGQWLLRASDFPSIPPSHNQIVGFALRPDEAAGPSELRSDRFAVKLSVTDVSSLGFAFDENFGETVQVAYDGPLNWWSTEMAWQPAKDFAYRIDFSEPFTYHPDMGNLLVDWTTTGIVPTLFADGINYPDSNVMVSAFASGSSPSMATRLDPIVVVTELTFVPEPTSAFLFGLGLMGLVVMRRRRVT